MKRILFSVTLLLLLIVSAGCQLVKPVAAEPLVFSGELAFQDVQAQVDLGPRIPGTSGHEAIRAWMQTELENAGWQVEFQTAERMGHPIYNIVAKRGSGEPWIILGAHYDTRAVADHDPTPANRQQPVPGANDGGSGVAVLLELARVLPEDLDKEIWLVFFDAEDQGSLAGWDWILGSRAFAESLIDEPDAVVIVDMVGDKDLNIYQERNSDPDLIASIWSTAAEAGYGDQFIPEFKHSMIDDHTPFLEKGIPAIDLIDFDNPTWHTLQDIPENVSPESLEAVGRTLQIWLNSPSPLAK